MRKILMIAVALAVAFCLAFAQAEQCERGSLRVDEFNGGAMGIRFVDAVIEEEADIISIWPNCTIHEAVLDELIMEGDNLLPRTVWTAETQESNEVINLRAYAGEVYPRFRFHFINEGGEAECWYIEQSGEDASYLLVEADVVESVMPIDLSSLRQAEENAAECEGLQETGTGQENTDEAARKLFQIWEDERIACWGGYAQSYGEQNWFAEREAEMERQAKLCEDDKLYTAVYYRTGAELTRQHVYKLLGIQSETVIE